MAHHKRTVDPPRTVTSRYAWADEDPAKIGLDIDPAVVGDDEMSAEHVNELLDVITTCRRGESFLAWTKYRSIAAMHDQLTPGTGDNDARLVSEHAQVAARIATTGATGQAGAMTALNEALAMVHRLPETGERLRTGVIERWQFARLVSRSDLIDGRGYRHAVDTEIATRLGRGSWSAKQLNDLVDKAIAKHDPDALRERRDYALTGRTVNVDPLTDGMAELRVTASVEDVKTAFAALTVLVKRVCCPNDPRTLGAKRSDAVIARLNDVPFECECPDPDSCTGTPEDAGVVTDAQVVIAFHVITEQGTLTAEPGSPEDGVGYIDGYGVITGDQVRDIHKRPDVVRKPFPPEPKGEQSQADPIADEPELDLDTEPEPPNPEPAPESEPAHEPPAEPEPSAEPADAPTHTDAPACYRKPVLPSPCLTSDPYRFTNAFGTYIRARDLTCSAPGCGRPAWASQLDHAREYNHQDPAAGGLTEPGNVHPLCLLHHLLKTGDHGWLDIMSLDHDGRLQYWLRTPEGIWIEGPGLSGIDLFPSLKNVRFAAPPTPTAPPPERAKPHRAATTDKHRRRQRERDRNKAAREQAARERLHARILGFSARLYAKHHPPPASTTPRTPDPDGDPPF